MRRGTRSDASLPPLRHLPPTHHQEKGQRPGSPSAGGRAAGGRTYPGARGAVAASRGQLHQHEQQVGREQAGAARGQHGARRAGQPAAGGGGGLHGAHGRAGLPAFLPPGGPGDGGPRRCGAGSRRLRSERTLMNRPGGELSASVCSACGALRSAGPRRQQVGCQSWAMGIPVINPREAWGGARRP